MSDTFETIIGKVCLERGWVAQHQLFDCLKQCATGADQAGGAPTMIALSDILVARGFVTKSQIEKLRREIADFFVAGSDFNAARKEDALLRHVLRTEGHVTKHQISEALEIQRTAAANGLVAPRLAEVLLHEGIVGFDVMVKVLQKQKRVRDDSNLKLMIPGYELMGQLGHGGMGAVYKARQVGLDRWVAIKVLRRLLAEDPDYLRRFLAEARTAGKLRHEHIVSALDCGQSGGRYYIIMEYVEGRTLAQILEGRGVMRESEALPLVRQVADALEYARQNQVVHRDVKPQNIMVTKQGVAKLCDLGLCRDVKALSSHTVTGSIQCTPQYASPEQARGEKGMDIRTDIYSLGCTLYELVTGMHVFDGESVGDLLIKQATEAPLPPIRKNPQISRAVNDLIMDMIQKAKEDRPATPAVVVERITGILAGASRPIKVVSSPVPRANPPTQRGWPEAPRPEEPKPETSSSSRALWISAGVLGMAAILLLVMLMQKRTLPPRSAGAAGPSAPEVAGGRPAPVPPADPQKARVREALEKARKFLESNPDDWAGQLAHFDAAVKAAEGTDLEGSAMGEYLDVVLAIKRDLPTEVERLDGELRPLVEAEEFARALGVLKEAGGSFGVPEWKKAVAEKVEGVQARARQLYPAARNLALEAARRGDAEALAKIRARAARWGEEYRTTLERDLAAVPAPAAVPTAPKVNEAWRARRLEALAFAARRDFAAAIRALEEGLPPEEDKGARAEAMDDLESLRAAAPLYPLACASFSKVPLGERLSILVADERGRPAPVEGRLVQAQERRVLLQGEAGEVHVAEFSDTAASSLVEQLRRRHPKPAELDAKALALLCILDGDEAAARGVLGGPAEAIPRRTWELAALARKPPAARELEARSLLHAAERVWRLPPAEAASVPAYLRLQGEFAETEFVKANRDHITRRLEAGREFAFFADTLRAGGGLARTDRFKGRKVDAVLYAEKDPQGPTARDHYAELEFYAHAETTYRAWAFVGGCCLETLESHVQASELTDLDKERKQRVSAEPGADRAVTVSAVVAGFKKLHDHHGGAREPKEWVWVKVPLPERFSAAGPKTVRIIAEARGFSISHVVVSGARTQAPSEAAIREWARAHAGTPPPQAAKGTILWEYWTGIPGAKVEDLRNSDRFKAAPDGRQFLSSFQVPSNFADNYGSRVRGYVHPPSSGDYTFWISSDDASELWLSPDDTPAAAQKIAGLAGYTTPANWTFQASQKSELIRLVAGRRYYIEALHKEGPSSDHLRVRWQLPDGTMDEPIRGAYLSPYPR